MLIGVFLAILAVPGLYQLRYGVGAADVDRWRGMLRDQPMAEGPKAIEADLNARFLPGQAARTLMLGVPVKAMRPMSPDVFFGSDGFLYNSVDVEVCRSAGFMHRAFSRPRKAIDTLAELTRRLQARGIHLLVVPVPAKASIYPEFLDKNYDLSKGPDLNVQHAEWMAAMHANGVDVLDLTDLMWRERANGPVYFPTETHWSQRVMHLAAGEIAARLRQRLTDLPPPTTFATRWIDHSRPGDLTRLRETPPDQYIAPDGPGDINEPHLVVVDDAGQPLQPGPEAPVLLIGDSFAAQFSKEGASIAHLLTERLGLPVQQQSLYGGKGPAIVRTLHAFPQNLERKRAVVLVFTIRLLLCCDWDQADLP